MFKAALAEQQRGERYRISCERCEIFRVREQDRSLRYRQVQCSLVEWTVMPTRSDAQQVCSVHCRRKLRAQPLLASARAPNITINRNTIRMGGSSGVDRRNGVYGVRRCGFPDLTDLRVHG